MSSRDTSGPVAVPARYVRTSYLTGQEKPVNAWNRLRAAASADLDEQVQFAQQAAPRVQLNTEWAVPALADLTAIACELSDSKLDQMERDRLPVWGYNGLGAAWLAERTLDVYPELQRLTHHNLRHLQQLGYIPWGAGLAAVVQGVKDPEFVSRLTPLARAWQHAGFRFPVAPFTIWHPHVPILGSS